MADDRPRTATAESPLPTGRASQVASKRRRSRLSFLTELPGLLLVSLGLALLIKTFVFQAFYIPSGSMEPTLEVGDRVLVNKVVYHIHPPRRGDIVVFSDPQPGPERDQGLLSAVWHWLTEGLGVSANPEKDFIKRVIGLPGETIEIQRGRILIDGRRIQGEPYLSAVRDLSDFGPHTVAKDSLFVMGDNRTQSSDSRSLLGDIPYDNVIGRAFVKVWPPSRVGLLRSREYALGSLAPYICAGQGVSEVLSTMLAWERSSTLRGGGAPGTRVSDRSRRAVSSRPCASSTA